MLNISKVYYTGFNDLNRVTFGFQSYMRIEKYALREVVFILSHFRISQVR